MPGYGGYAQYVIAKQSALVEIAGNVDYITAAAFPVAYTTSHLALKVKVRAATKYFHSNMHMQSFRNCLDMLYSGKDQAPWFAGLV